MEKGLISVVIPCYNVEKYLKDCVDSLDAQTYKNFEVIFVNDGSTDDTLAVLKTLCQGKPNYKIYTKTNGGASSARNIGIKFCNGEYVQFLDADDMLAPNYLQVMKDSIQGQDICVCRFNRCKEHTKFSKKMPKLKKKMLSFNDNTDILCQYLSTRRFRPAMGNKMYRHEIMQKMPNYPNCFDKSVSYGEDSLFISNYLKFCNKAKWIDFNGYYYRARKGSSVHSGFSENKLSVFKMHESNFKTFADNKQVLTYAQSYFCVSCVEMLFRIYVSEYENPQLVKDLYDNLKLNLPALKKSKRCPWYNRKLIPIAVPLMKPLLKRKMVQKKRMRGGI